MTEIKAKPSFTAFLDKALSAIKKLGKRLLDKKYLYPSFFLPILIMTIVYACLAIYPFGDRSILILDMNAQYVYFFEQLRDIITSDESIFYSFERALGGEFVGIYAYYLASPLSLLIVLFPRSMTTEAIKVIMLLKCGLSGLSFSYYLDKTRKKNAVGFTIFSTMYALCAYAVSFQSNIMWMDALIWLPLITLGIERVIKTGHFKLYVVSLAVAVWSNYYIGYMLCIYVALYFFCYLFSHSNEEINLLGEKLHRLKSLGRIVLYSIVALLISAFIIFGAMYSLSFGKSTHQSAELTFTLNHDFLDIVTKLFAGSYDTVRPDGYPNIYSGLLMLIMLPSYFLSKHVKAREKILYTVLCLVFVASFSINALNLAWHGFQPPVWLSYRYSFLFSFVTLIMAYRGFENLKEIKGRTLLLTGTGLIALLLVIQKLCTIPRYNREHDAVEQMMPDFQIIWLSIGFIILYTIVLYFSKKPKLPMFMSVLLVVLVSFEMLSSSLINWTEQINDVGWASRTSYTSFVSRVSVAMEHVGEVEKDTVFFRTEKTVIRKNNDSYALDMNGVSEFTSTFNKDVIKFLKKTGFVSRSQASKYISGNEVIDSLLGIKYVISNGPNNSGYISDPVSNLYDKHYIESENLYVSKNPYALSIAYGVDSNIKKTVLEYEDVYSALEYTEIFAGAMMGLEYGERYKIFDPCIYQVLYRNNCTVSSSGDTLRFVRNNSSASSSVTFNVVATKNGCVYAYLPSPYTTKATLYVNDKFASNLFNSDYQRIVNLGYFEKGESIRVRLDFSSSYISLNSDYPFFVQVNEEKLNELYSTLSAEELKITEFKDTKITGTLSVATNKTIFTSIPYDAGWNVYVDGKRVETLEVTETFLAFDVEAGEHEIVMKYMPKEYVIGIILSCTGILLFVALIIIHKKWGAKVIVAQCSESLLNGSVPMIKKHVTKRSYILRSSSYSIKNGQKIIYLKQKENEDKDDISC